MAMLMIAWAKVRQFLQNRQNCGKDREKNLKSYAVARYKAIQFPNGRGRIDEEDPPGGWFGAVVHKNENRDRLLVWTVDKAMFFPPSESFATYGRSN
jgi:hypothetical protein